jgi:hypothetical protein
MSEELNRIPEKPLYASMDGKIETPEDVYFFELEDGRTIFVKEKEACNLYKRKPQILGVDTRRPKFLGVSNGFKFRKALEEAREISKTDLKKAQERIRQGEKEELEIAKGNLRPPRDFDNVDLHGRPTIIQPKI